LTRAGLEDFLSRPNFGLALCFPSSLDLSLLLIFKTSCHVIMELTIYFSRNNDDHVIINGIVLPLYNITQPKPTGFAATID